MSKADKDVVLYDADVERTVDALVMMYAKWGIALALKSGELVVQGLFNGDLEAACKRGPKQLALKSLARHPRVRLKKRELYLAVSLYAWTVRHGDLPKSEHLTVSHMEAILPAPKELQEELVRGVVEQHWSVPEVRKRVAALPGRRQLPERQQPPAPVHHNPLEHLLREAQRTSETLDVAPSDRATSVQIVGQIRLLLEKMAAKLAEHETAPPADDQTEASRGDAPSGIHGGGVQIL